MKSINVLSKTIVLLAVIASSLFILACNNSERINTSDSTDYSTNTSQVTVGYVCFEEKNSEIIPQSIDTNIENAAKEDDNINIVLSVETLDCAYAGAEYTVKTENGEYSGDIKSEKAYTEDGKTGKITLSEGINIKEKSDILVLAVKPYIYKNGKKIYGNGKNTVYYMGTERRAENISTDGGYYVIENPADLIIFADTVRFEQTAKAYLKNDIELGNYLWTPIGSLGNEFQGIFDGRNHTVKGGYVKGDYAHLGFFGVVGQNATVKDLNFSRLYIFANENKYVGCTAQLDGRMINVNMLEDTVIKTESKDGQIGTYKKSGSMHSLGGIVGVMNGKYDCEIKECNFSGKIELQGENITYCGGIVGRCTAVAPIISKCTFSGELSIKSMHTYKTLASCAIGGVVGAVHSSLVYGCVNTGSIVDYSTSTTLTGGIVGVILGAGRVCDCEGSKEASIKITQYGASGSYCGGIVGGITSEVSASVVLRCANETNISSNALSGAGIVGYADKRCFIEYCYNNAQIISENKYQSKKISSGGIVGYVNSEYTSVMNCFSIGRLSAKGKGESVTGGIIGLAGDNYKTYYLGRFYKDDVYKTYVNNSYLAKNANTGIGTIDEKSGECTAENIYSDVMSKQKEASNCYKAYEPYVENNGKVSLIWQTDSDKISGEIPDSIYVIHSSTIENNGDDYYYVKRYVNAVNDRGERNITFFIDNMDERSESTHSVLEANGWQTREECSCTVFDRSHYLTIDEWKQILSGVEKYIQKNADIANYGEIKPIPLLVAETDFDKSNVNATCSRRLSDAETLKIMFNVKRFKDTDRSSTVCHEITHSQAVDVGVATWMTEGFATLVAMTEFQKAELDAYEIKIEDFKQGYEPCAAFYNSLINRYGNTALVLIREIGDKGTGECEDLYKECFGRSIYDLWQRQAEQK